MAKKKWMGAGLDVRELHTGLVQQVSVALLASTLSDVIIHLDESHTGSLRRPSCIKGGPAALCLCCCKNTRLMLMNFETTLPSVSLV